MPVLTQHIKTIEQAAKKLGFIAVGWVDLTQNFNEIETLYRKWIETNYHGEMHYMQKNIEQRFNPNALLENAYTAIVVLAPYSNKPPQLNSQYKISRYAVGLDYHFILKEKLNKLLTFIQQFNPQITGRAFTDSAPILERYLAIKAGLGFIGKNGMLVHPDYGSFTFIGELFLNQTIEHGSSGKFDPAFSQCAECDICLKACPNQAITNPGVIDSRKCTSYNTIEFKGEFEKKQQLSGYIYGCDICQQVCPFNKNKQFECWEEFNPKPEIINLTEKDWENLGSNKFKRIFGNTVLFRVGLKKLRRNIKNHHPQKN